MEVVSLAAFKSTRTRCSCSEWGSRVGQLGAGAVALSGGAGKGSFDAGAAA